MNYPPTQATALQQGRQDQVDRGPSITGQVSSLGTPPKLPAGSTPPYRQSDHTSNVVGPQQHQPLGTRGQPQAMIPVRRQTQHHLLRSQKQQHSLQYQNRVAQLKAELEQQERLSQSESKQEVLNEVQMMLQQFQQQIEQKALHQVQQQINLWAQIAQVTQIQSQGALIESLTTSLDSAQRRIRELEGEATQEEK
ncbi:hypothetical protein EYZ11_006833 [Aspergillus tanneri]|uniref:Uncharacterized protein n=1 Tax=Aspergillus tanneri TaxID=1220188 RepID=A0A4S3JEG9_9EURO|nr:uncharacterized protein ATNIH1004_006615 [Aspergillus tanneri]KAA8647913.1 hypothetical protein ATNIH1004_006615 [Aspergillus tanneri]THC93689.1 hypothetical protein EYZ11_006833 [Aspergillus tanneri]